MNNLDPIDHGHGAASHVAGEPAPAAGTQDDLYRQDLELRLLLALFQRLQNKTYIDIGAERGTFLQAFLDAGATGAFAFEPYPAHIAYLREKYASDARVRLFELAVGERDEAVKLRIASDVSGRKFDYHHTLVPFEQNSTVRWDSEIAVNCRKLGSLAGDGSLPSKTGILKTDTEGNDLAVIAGMGGLHADLLLIEFWEDLPLVYGRCPYTIADLDRLLRPRGYSNFVISRRHDEFNTLQFNEMKLCAGDWGNILYIHDSVFASMAPVIFGAVAKAQNALIAKAIVFRTECDRRNAVIANLAQAAEERLDLINRLTQTSTDVTDGDHEKRLRKANRELVKKERVITGLLQAGNPSVRNRAGITRFFFRLGRSIRKRTVNRLVDGYRMQPGVLHQHTPKEMRTEKFPKPALPESELPSIVIVTPSYMQGKYLERTIQSVLTQEYPRLSYIIQDGGSKDNSVEIIKRHESRLATWQSAPDGGQSAAIRRGFERSKGEIMAWLNSDDMLMPGALRYIGEYFAAHPDVDAIYGHRVIINEKDKEVGRWVLPRHDSEILKWADYVPQETLFWRRELWDTVGGIDPTFHFAMDWELLLKFQDAGAKIVRLPYFLGCFRTHSSQKTTCEMVNSTGEREMALIRERIHGRPTSHLDLEPHVRRYLTKGAFTAYLLSMGIRV